jgi:hypothetical protein
MSEEFVNRSGSATHWVPEGEGEISRRGRAQQERQTAVQLLDQRKLSRVANVGHGIQRNLKEPPQIEPLLSPDQSLARE